MNDEREPHAAVVAAWMTTAATDLDADRLAALLGAATTAVWRRAQRTLGDVTLAAIVDRVVSTSAEEFSFFAAAEMHPDGVTFASSSSIAPTVDDAQLRAAVAFFLTELLTVLGHLTADILTPALHEALSTVREGRT